MGSEVGLGILHVAISLPRLTGTQVVNFGMRMEVFCENGVFSRVERHGEQLRSSPHFTMHRIFMQILPY